MSLVNNNVLEVINNIPNRGRPKKIGSKGASKHCCYGVCTSDSKKVSLVENESPSYFFIGFPKPCLPFRKGFVGAEHLKNCELCSKSLRWIQKCKRQDGKFHALEHITKDTYICSLHFIGSNGPTIDNPDPILASASSRIKSTKARKRPKERCQNFPVKRQQLEIQVAEVLADLSSVHSKESPVQSNDVSFVEPDNSELLQNASENMEISESKTKSEFGIQAQPNNSDCATQTDEYLQNLYIQKLLTENQNLQNKVTQLEGELKNASKPFVKFEETVRYNTAMCVFYTGLTFQQILILMSFLGSAVQNMTYWGKSEPKKCNTGRKKSITLLQELLVVLVRLKTGLVTTDLSFRFNISKILITRLVTTWVQVMYIEFNKLRPQMFPSRDNIKANLPSCFKHFNNVRVVVDCTEFFSESPSNFEHQSNLYSSYKAHTTFKSLIGCSPTGAITFVSELFEGAISDRELFKKCGIINLLKRGDLVIADRGFTVQDVLSEIGVDLNIPPFLNGRDRLTPQEEMLTKKIAKVRIFVEHAIGRIKQFRILNKTLPLSMRGYLSQIVFVFCCLVNFQQPIVK